MNLLESRYGTSLLRIMLWYEFTVTYTTVIRLVDRDDRSPQEISDLQKSGVRVLLRRHLESYLLDDEVLSALCAATGSTDKLNDVLAIKAQAVKDSVARGNPADDMKSAAGEIYVAIKQMLQLTQCGNTTTIFLRDTMAPLVAPGMSVYDDLKQDIFGD